MDFGIEDLDILCICQGERKKFIEDFTLTELLLKQRAVCDVLRLLIQTVDQYLPMLKSESARKPLTSRKKRLLMCLEANQNLDSLQLFKEGKDKYTQMRGEVHNFFPMFGFLEVLCNIYRLSSHSDKYPKYQAEDIAPLYVMLQAFHQGFQKIGIFGLSQEEAYPTIMGEDGRDIMDIDSTARVTMFDDNHIPGGVSINSMPYFILYPYYRPNGQTEYFPCVVHSASLFYNDNFFESLEKEETSRSQS